MPSIVLSCKTMSISRSDVRKLFKALLRHSRRFANVDTRNESMKFVIQEFAKYKTATNPYVIKKAYYDGLTHLNLIKNQATISQMFATSSIHSEKERTSSP